MARPKEFDPAVALERAMHTFWRHGFEATSTQMLERELGINRSSIYATFGSKAELYELALKHYTDSDTIWGPVRPGALDGDDPLADKVARLLWSAVEADIDAGGVDGCFACNAAVELGPRDEQIRVVVRDSFLAARAVFRDAFALAQHSGELRSTADVDALASLMLATLEGLQVLARGTADKRLVGQAIQGAIAALR